MTTPIDIKHNGSLQVVANHQCLLGEGPVWNASEQCIMWVDILRGHIHQFYPFTNEYKLTKLGEPVTSVNLISNNGQHMLITLRNVFGIIHMKTGMVKTLAEIDCKPTDRFNDGKCDPAGRLWAGTLTKTSGEGKVYVLELNKPVLKKIHCVSCSNGMAWSVDSTQFYYVDTTSQQVVAYDYDLETGNIQNKRTVIEIPSEMGAPDGMTIDTEGMLWIALWGGWMIGRWNPRTGQLLGTIRFPVSLVSSCTFGGENMDDLYVTSARIGLSDEERKQQPLAGSLFVLKNTGYKGFAPFEFNYESL